MHVSTPAKIGSNKAGFAIAVIMALIVCAAEVAFGIFTPFWDRLVPSRVEKQGLYAQLLTSGRKVDHVFIGSSTTLMGIDPGLVDRETGRTSFNAGQLGYTALNLNIAVAEELLKAGVTRNIVHVIDSWVASLPDADRESIDRHGRSDHFLWMSNIFRNRSVFFFWAAQLAKGRFLDPREAWQHHLRASQRFLSYDGVKLYPTGYLETFGLMNVNWPEYVRPKLIGPRERQGLADLITLTRKHGATLTVIRPPEHQRTYDENAAAHGALTAHLRDLAQAGHIRLIDLSLPGTFEHGQDAIFFDIHHVNHVGAKLLSQQIGKALR